MVSIVLSFKRAMSFITSEIFQLRIATILNIKSNNVRRQRNTAIPFGILLFSIQLQKGKNSIAKIPPITNGIMNTLP